MKNDGRDYDEKVDIFSFGVNLWELMTRRIPWDQISNVKERVLKLIASTKSKANHVAEEALN